jgi:hypothetical protein
MTKPTHAAGTKVADPTLPVARLTATKLTSIAVIAP